MDYSKIILNKGKEFSMQRMHPWVFSGAIAKKDSTLADGDIVEIYSHQNQYLGTGYYSGGGSISVRIISFVKTIINEDFWFDKINKAYQYRLQLSILNPTTNVCRLFFGEGDGVPGLILDYYDGNVVFQAHSWGVYLQKDNIANAIKKVLGSSLKSIYDKSAETLSKHHAEKSVNGFIFGTDEEIIVKENNHLFKIDFINGQKTGFFIDQRDNRKLLADYSKGKAVLNTFCYTGGFSVYSAAAGATIVHSVDSSQSAITMCDKNMELNNIKNNESYAIDTFDFLKDKQNIYDVIVLDPPAFAKSRDSKHNAVIGYKRLNALAIKLIKPNGIIFTFSCSGVVDKYLFYNTITAAAIEARRNVKILHYLIQPADHPVTPYFAEGEYLKGMVLWVE
ncbi:MAG: class I SAM-dependent rRNA methyltransferase [Bacteroidota bacterium]|nr:class I SAM-dependent rRNA methyltransferase [Bacteroidota bacterium]MDP3146092.1 class I SAM-dependent rRNA methyltransferase [Bacteroidota bacterium]